MGTENTSVKRTRKSGHLEKKVEKEDKVKLEYIINNVSLLLLSVSTNWKKLRSKGLFTVS